ncbi:MAG TPA: hypothetical protein VFV88_09380 [Steroidobacteraceae bacterium]|jgi:hypothetical protein|nr:hypothetical protein [Steroidobacteraceae bacterium]
MATPGENRDQLIRDLRATRTQLMSAEWLSMIREAPKPQRQAAADNLMKVQLALLDLETQALAAFRDQLIENEGDIAASSKRMRMALARLESTAKVLKAVGDFIGVVARVVTLF